MPQALPRVLEVLSVNFNLERLVLEYCGLGNESMMALVGFLSKLEQRPFVFFSTEAEFW